MDNLIQALHTAGFRLCDLVNSLPDPGAQLEAWVFREVEMSNEIEGTAKSRQALQEAHLAKGKSKGPFFGMVCLYDELIAGRQTECLQKPKEIRQIYDRMFF